jgi:hypothetical protein
VYWEQSGEKTDTAMLSLITTSAEERRRRNQTYEHPLHSTDTASE